MRDEVTGAAALRSTTLQSLGLTGGSATIRFVMKRVDAEGGPQTGAARSKTPASPADQVAGGPLPPLNSEELSCGDLSRQGEAGTSGAWHTDGPKPADAPAKQSVQEPGPARFVPFSGGGQRLGGPSGSGRSLTSPSAKLPTSASSPGGPSKPKKSKPGEEPPQEPEPPLVTSGPGCPPGAPLPSGCLFATCPRAGVRLPGTATAGPCRPCWPGPRCPPPASCKGLMVLVGSLAAPTQLLFSRRLRTSPSSLCCFSSRRRVVGSPPGGACAGCEAGAGRVSFRPLHTGPGCGFAGRGPAPPPVSLQCPVASPLPQAPCYFELCPVCRDRGSGGLPGPTSEQRRVAML
uniref:Uncharacterized protein n=1 Tax=Oryctolagus cuniculus TaxID=9986 RepID=A0A5F9CL60_RABIT